MDHALLILILMSAAGQAQSPPDREVGGWQVLSSLNSLEVTSVHQVGASGQIRFTLKNVSAKPIMGAAISADRSAGPADHHMDWSDSSGGPLAPGAEEETSEFVKPETPHIIRLFAVLFDDGSWEGEKAQADLMFYLTMGQMLERERVFRLLQRAGPALASVQGLTQLSDQLAGRFSSPEAAFEAETGSSLPGLDIRVFASAADLASRRASDRSECRPGGWGARDRRGHALPRDPGRRVPAAL